MGTRGELAALVGMLDASGVRPVIDATLPLERGPRRLPAMAGGDVFGKVVLTR